MTETAFTPGTWLAVVGANATVVLAPTEKARAGALWALVDDGAGFSDVLDALLADGLRGLPAFVLVSEERAVVRGEVSVTFTTSAGEVEIDGRDSATWVERTLPGLAGWSLSLEDSDAEPHVIGGGLVRVSGLQVPAPAVVTTSSASPSATPASAMPGLSLVPPPVPPVLSSSDPLTDPFIDEPEPVPEPVPEPQPVFMAKPEPVFAPEPPAEVEPDLPTDVLPVVSEELPGVPPPPVGPPPGVSPPAVSGLPPAFSPPPAPPVVPAAVAQNVEHDGHTRSGVPFAGEEVAPPPAPVTAFPVARLEFSSGDQVDVDRLVVVGRAPDAGRFSQAEQPLLVTVPSPHQEISSTHLEVRPGTGADHGAAVVTDLGSTNGTVLVQPGLGAEELRAGVPVQLLPGAVIDLGDGLTIRVSTP